ncbi:protein indeterminate-domain 7-like isoform X2 [Benincasa hispida]|uniref:protein indeterminate-domain 7-like isoform X2 n=1 Tax=Benincasa hispida TaxID=102211 RepID=UPI001900BF36|nr:protein indeterminate-domain 7-like isoform X2 [Benincasa hispida]
MQKMIKRDDFLGMIKSLLFQQQAQAMEENLSNLTSASGEASACSGNHSDQIPTNYSGQYFATTQPPPPKKKRNLPGNPDPDAEVIALSPKTLMATNRFVCEICGKGFQRDQNLQLHRRGHNLPWKLKQRTNKEVIRKKVYVCPETSCVHHDPSRALGDLTGIKKHFCRKHGEKKWKCDKCSKKYAVQSDWKAHSKTCGTREYRCDCGTLFSRRDSFITHRAFCDALAEESARAITSNPILMTNNINTNQNHLLPPLSSTPNISHLNFQITQQTHFNSPPLDNSHHINSFNSLKKEQNINIPPWLGFPNSTSNDHNNNHHQIINPNHNNLGPTSLHLIQSASPSSPHMSATALLQKAAQMGATMSSNTEPPHTITPQQHNDNNNNNNTNCNFGLDLSSASSSSRDIHQQQNQTLMMMGSTSNCSSTTEAAGLSHALPFYRNKTNFEGGASFELEQFGGVFKKNIDHQAGLSTRDFLGLRAISHTEFLSNIAAAGYSNCINNNNNNNVAAQTPQQTQIQNQSTWQG